MNRRKLGILAAVVAGCALTGCGTLAPGSGGYYSSPLQPGAEITVVRELEVPSGTGRLYLQGGNRRTYGSVDQYAPFCYFRMDEPLPVVQIIRPGAFRVRSVSLIETQVRLSLPVQVAGWGFDGDRGPIAFQSYMRLSGDHQREVRALVCYGAFDSPLEARPIRLEELREALGDAVIVRRTPAPGRVD